MAVCSDLLLLLAIGLAVSQSCGIARGKRSECRRYCARSGVFE